MASGRPPENPWNRFKVHRAPERPRAGKGILILAVVFVLVLGGGVGAVVGALWNPGLRRTRMERLARDTPEKMVFRATVGGAIGSAAGLLVLWKGWKRRDD